MKKLVAALAVAVVVLACVAAWQSIPSSTKAPKHSAAYQRVEKMVQALQKGDWKYACDVLAWYSFNQGAPEPVCEQLMQGQFAGTDMQYKMVGEVTGREGRYYVVSVLIVQDDASTKVNESAVCQAKWAKGQDCVWAGVYTFGVALYPSPSDAVASVKHPQRHFYAMWID